jgi:hypothetical protein
MERLTPLVWEPDRLDAIVETFERDGVVAVEGLLPKADIAAADGVADAFLGQLDGKPWAAGEDYCRRFDIWTKVFSQIDEPAVARLFDDPVMQRLTEALAGAGAAAGGIGSWVTPEGCGQAWHQDSWSEDPALFILNRIVFTRDMAPEQGRLVAVPGSHRAGDLPPGEPYEPLPGQQALAPAANTTVFLHTRTFHCVEKNRTARPRIQFNRRVVPAGVPQDLTSRARFRNGTWDFVRSAPW